MISFNPGFNSRVLSSVEDVVCISPAMSTEEGADLLNFHHQLRMFLQRGSSISMPTQWHRPSVNSLAALGFRPLHRRSYISIVTPVSSALLPGASASTATILHREDCISITIP